MFRKYTNSLLIVIFSLVAAVLLTTSVSALEEDKQKVNVDKKTQVKQKKQRLLKKKNSLVNSLSFSDFPLVTDFAGDTQKLQKYTTEVLQEQYKATPAVFSSAIPYGLALIDLGQIDRAYDVFEQAEKDFLGNPTPKAYKGWVHARKREYEKAYEYFYPLAKEKYEVGIVSFSAGLWLPPHIDSVVGLTLIQDKLSKEQRKDAEVIISAVLKHFKWQPKFTAINAMKDINNGKLDEAKEKIEYVKSMGQDYPLLNTLLGVVSYANGDFDESLNHYDIANKENPYSPLNYLMKSRSLIALGEKEQAIEAVNFALELDPDFEFAKEEKQKILNPSKGFFSTIAGIFTKDSQEN